MNRFSFPQTAQNATISKTSPEILGKLLLVAGACSVNPLSEQPDLNFATAKSGGEKRRVCSLSSSQIPPASIYALQISAPMDFESAPP
jgi:hypothetical protein